MKVCLVCGGTGGHIYPALAIAEQLTNRFFIGGSRLEKELIPAGGYKFYEIPAHPRNPLKIVAGFLKAWWILHREKPDVIISTGGYVTLPVILAGKLQGRRIYLQEQNLLPGKVNRYLSRLVYRVFISYQESAKYFRKGQALFTGNPVRREVAAIRYSSVPNATNASQASVPKILFFGGSLSARSITLAARELAAKSKLNYEVILLDGTNYCHNMADLYRQVALVVCRAGATSLAELAASGVPAILVPYPYAAENHQELNARYFVKNGAAAMILDQELTPERLDQTIQALLTNHKQLLEMSKKMASLGKKNAAEAIVSYLVNSRSLSHI